MQILKNIFYRLRVFILCLPAFLWIEAQAVPLNCEVSAPSAILINAETGRVLYEKNARVPVYPASTTKVATALYALHLKGKDLMVPVKASADAVGAVSPNTRRMSGKHPSYRLEFGGTHMGLKVNEVLDLQTLLYGLMLASGNDAANVVAEYCSGSVPHFMKGLNHFLQQIGCEHTRFRNPHGLSDPHHQTTAYDMALMTRYAMRNPVFREIVQTTRYTRPKTNKQEEGYLVQHNALLKPGKFYYPSAIGVKTGYTTNSGHNLVAAAQSKDRSLIAAAFYCDESAKRYRSVINLFEAAFNEAKVSRTLFSQEYDLFHKPVHGGDRSLDAKLLHDVVIEYYPSEETEYSSEIRWDEIALPLEEGAMVGAVLIYDEEGQLKSTVPLIAIKPIYPTWTYRTVHFLDHMSLLLKRHKHYCGALIGVALLAISFGVHFKRRKRESIIPSPRKDKGR